MNKTKIEWTDYSWNPIKGVCPVGCWYCYARAMYKRFGWDEKVRIDEQEIYGDIFPKKSSKIFVCSTFELFHPSIHKMIRDVIFSRIEQHPQHTFQILTKLPQNIDRPMPENVHLGVSVTGDKDVHRIKNLIGVPARIKFVSIEPFLKSIYVSAEPYLKQMDWIIVGRLTGHGKKYDPNLIMIQGIECFARNCNIPIFLKNNLKEIWRTPLIQEFPKTEDE